MLTTKNTDVPMKILIKLEVFNEGKNSRGFNK